MSTITVFESITLDGVMQGLGRSAEDLRGGFATAAGVTGTRAAGQLGGARDSGTRPCSGRAHRRGAYRPHRGHWANYRS